jgi:hypothetical protein
MVKEIAKSQWDEIEKELERVREIKSEKREMCRGWWYHTDRVREASRVREISRARTE